MRKFTSIALLLSFMICSTLVAQNDTIWYNWDWKKTTVNKARFFRPPPKKLELGYLIADYYVNGEKQMEGVSLDLEEAIYHGEVKYFDHNGQLQANASYSEGVLNGPNLRYYENGRIREQLFYREGLMIDDSTKVYAENGALEFPTHFKNKITTLKNNLVQDPIFQSTPKVDGQFTVHYANQVVAFKGTIVSGHREGTWRYYDQEANIVVKENYTKGKLEGKQYFYNKEAVVVKRLAYRNNQLHGSVILFDDNHKSTDMLYFIDGKEIYSSRRFNVLYYEKTNTGKGYQVVQMDKRKGKQEVSSIKDQTVEDLNKFMDEYGVEERRIFNITKMHKVFDKTYFECEDKNLNSIIFSIQITGDGSYVLEEPLRYKPKANEVLFLYEIDEDDDYLPNRVMGFVFGSDIKKALQKKSLNYIELLRYLEHRVFGNEPFSVFMASDYFEEALKEN